MKCRSWWSAAMLWLERSQARRDILITANRIVLYANPRCCQRLRQSRRQNIFSHPRNGGRFSPMKKTANVRGRLFTGRRSEVLRSMLRQPPMTTVPGDAHRRQKKTAFGKSFALAWSEQRSNGQLKKGDT